MIIMNVEKKLGDVLIKCDFKLDSNGITAVYGASGAGKTSIVNMMAGLISPDSGIISFRDKEFFNHEKKINIPADKRFIGYVFQDSRLFPNMSVKDNLLYGSKRKSSYSLSCNLEQVCELLGINHLLERYPQKLSGGEKQRVAIGRALLSNPEMLLMDEPLASLDSLRAKELMSYINIIRNNYNIPILYVSHSIDEIMQLADNAIYMEHGALKYYGKAVEVLNKTSHTNSENASFNTIFEGVVKEYDKQSSSAVILFGAGIVESACEDVEIGKKVRFSINVDDVVLSIDYPKNISIRNIYNGVVSNIVKNKNNLYDIEINIGESIWARISSGAFKDLNIACGKNIYVMFKSAAVTDSLRIVH